MWSIECDYITNFEVRYEIIERKSSEIILLRKGDNIVKLGKISSGYYVIKEKLFFAIYLSGDNLNIQFNDTKYNLNEGLLDMKVNTISDEFREFLLFKDNHLLESIQYKRQVEFDCWSTEDDLDMFAWLIMRYKEGNLENLLQKMI